MANMSNGGLTPMRTAAELTDIGYALAIFPAMTSLVAAAAMEQALTRLKNDGEGHPAEMPIFDFQGILRADRLPGGVGLRGEVGPLEGR